MKSIFTLFLVISPLVSISQNSIYTGTYSNKTTTEKGETFEYTLTLQEDGTFVYHFYRQLQCESCVEEHFYGKGTWKDAKKGITFYTQKTDIDANHTVNLGKSKAKLHKKMSKKKSSKKEKITIRFITSDVPNLNGLQLFKE